MKKNGWKLGLAVAVVGVVLQAALALASPPGGFAATTLAFGQFGEIDVRNLVPRGGGDRHDDDDEEGEGERAFWRSVQRTRGPSDLYVQSNVWQPGGTTGWHTHPGHSLIIVTQGTIAVYEGDDPACRPHLYTVGEGFVDPGGDHVHVIRNEGSVEARTTAVQLIPRGAARRIDAPGSAACPF